MSDAELQELRQRWRRDGDPEAERALLARLRRLGWVDDLLTEVAAACGSEAAERLREGAAVRLGETHRQRLRSGDPRVAASVLLQGRRREMALDAVLWAAAELIRPAEADEGSRALQAAVDHLLQAPEVERFEHLLDVGSKVAAAGRWSRALVEACLGQPIALRGLSASARSSAGAEGVHPDVVQGVAWGLRAWVLSGPLGRTSLLEVQRERARRVVRCELVASPAFRASLEPLARWVERADGEGVFRLIRAAPPLALPGEGPLVAEATFAALREHVGPLRTGFGMLFTERPDGAHWFARHEGDLAVIHVDRFVRRELEAPNLIYAAHMLVKKALDLILERRLAGRPGLVHDRSRGCLFDRCREKARLDDRIRAGAICSPCRELLGGSVPPAVLGAGERVLEAARREVLGRRGGS